MRPRWLKGVATLVLTTSRQSERRSRGRSGSICKCKFRGPVPGGSKPIYVLAMRGHFSSGGHSSPRGATIPPATVITLYYTASSLSPEGESFGGPYPDLKALGKPVRLDTPPPHHKT